MKTVSPVDAYIMCLENLYPDMEITILYSVGESITDLYYVVDDEGKLKILMTLPIEYTMQVMLEKIIDNVRKVMKDLAVVGPDISTPLLVEVSEKMIEEYGRVRKEFNIDDTNNVE